MTETDIIAIFVFFGEFRKNDDVIRKSAILGKKLKIQIKLSQRSNHGKFHVKVCNWRAAMAKRWRGGLQPPIRNRVKKLCAPLFEGSKKLCAPFSFNG